MDGNSIMLAYFDKFGENPGVPWEGFPDEATEKEYWQTLQNCVDQGVPLSDEQRNTFFPDMTGDEVV